MNGCNIFAYDGRKDTAAGKYDVVIEYAGRKLHDNISGKVQIFSDSKIEATANKNTRNFYGENVIIKAYDDSFESEVLSCADYY